jgi:hypothetical protein
MIDELPFNPLAVTELTPMTIGPSIRRNHRTAGPFASRSAAVDHRSAGPFCMLEALPSTNGKNARNRPGNVSSY